MIGFIEGKDASINQIVIDDLYIGDGKLKLIGRNITVEIKIDERLRIGFHSDDTIE